MRYRNSQLNNKGFSLVELIVTILIIAILSTSTVMTISVVYNSDVDRAAKTLTTVINDGRQKNISIADSEHSASTTKTEVFSSIYLDANGYYCADVYSQDITTTVDEDSNVLVDYGPKVSYSTKQLGKYKMSIEFGEYNSATGAVDKFAPNFEGGDVVVFCYDKARGAIKESYVEKTDGTRTDYNITDAFVVGSKEINLIFVRETGRCYIYE